MEFHSTDGFPESAIRLISGKVFDYADPWACEEITIHDVAHALARTSRYGGHIAYSYTVAQHALLVADLVAMHYKEPDLALGALHHDDVEFVTGDWPSPMKRYIKSLGFDYKEQLERKIEPVICKWLNLSIDELHAGVVKDADRLAFVIEGLALKPDFDPTNQGFDDVDLEQANWLIPHIPMLSISGSEAVFMKAHEKLMAGEISADGEVGQVEQKELPAAPEDFHIPDDLSGEDLGDNGAPA